MKTEFFEATTKTFFRNNFHRVMRNVMKMGTLFVRPEGHVISRKFLDSFGLLKNKHVVYSHTRLAGMKTLSITPDVQKGQVMASKVILFCHGGGFVLGSPKSHQGIVSHIVKTTGIKALIIGYRLAPEHQYPAPVIDAYEAYSALLSQGYSAKDIIVMGDSAGGGMTLALLCRLKKEGKELPLCGVMLYPWCDYEARLASVDKNHTKDSMLNGNLVRKFASLAFDSEQQMHEYSLRNYDLSDLPPILIQTGTDDVLHDDALEISDILAKHNNAGQTEIWQGMTHAWHGYVGILDESKGAIHNIAKFINQLC